MDELGIPWPVSLGLAGVSIAALVSILVWLIRRQASGEWYTSAQVTKLLDEKDKTIAIHQAIGSSWQAAHATLAVTHAETVKALGEAVDAARANDRAWDLLAQLSPATPRGGHNGATAHAEGVPL